jgi:predicted SAM-dependent methyltransferase
MNATAALAVPSVLHVGCGGQHLPDWMGACHEVRLDADERCKPDIVATMTDLGDVGPFDMVYCSHALEHLMPSDVMTALAEFKRVLRPNGAVLIFVPDLEGIKPNFEKVYDSPMGPITGHDMHYGHVTASETNHFMRHLTGFMQDTLAGALTQAGFRKVKVERQPTVFQLFGVGHK